MTSAGGVRADVADPDSRIATLTPSQAREAIEQGIIRGGMIPKVADALDPLSRGVGVVHILGASSLRTAASSPGRVGTALVQEGRA